MDNINNNDLIKNVWKDNFEQEMANIRHFIKEYNYVSMDTEFPGVIAKPIGNFCSTSSYIYQQLRNNVNILNLIQLGISLSDQYGNRPSPIHTWQFNMEYILDQEMFSTESIGLLRAADIDFTAHKEKGIPHKDLGNYLLTSGLVLSENIVWISFHSSSDFAYLVKILTGESLPEKDVEFYKLLKIFFPYFYDLKYMVKNTDFLRKGLQEISNTLGVLREGTAHQAGSDALLTSATFFKSLEETIDSSQLSILINRLYGIDLCEY